jgi:hypothetical protein
MLRMFAMVFKCFYVFLQVFQTHVSSISFIFRHMSQVLYLNVSNVDRVLYMLQCAPPTAATEEAVRDWAGRRRIVGSGGGADAAPSGVQTSRRVGRSQSSSARMGCRRPFSLTHPISFVSQFIFRISAISELLLSQPGMLQETIAPGATRTANRPRILLEFHGRLIYCDKRAAGSF